MNAGDDGRWGKNVRLVPSDKGKRKRVQNPSDAGFRPRGRI